MKAFNSGKKAVIVLIFIILAQTLYTIGVFQTKQNFHADETWSYGLANGFYRPFFCLQPGISLINKAWQACDNTGEWLDGEFFNDYITVDESDKFRYDSVISNQAHDMHPPLYFAILHTISSFFPDQFSWYFAFPINIISLCITQIFLYRLAYELSEKRTVALLVCFSYACSIAALFTFVFIRHYAMLTMWCTIVTYLYVRLFKSDFNLKKYLPSIIITVMFTAFTQQMGLMYAGALTFFTCLYLLFKKRYETMFKFGFAMAVTAVVYITIWPYAIEAAPIHASDHMFSYSTSVKRYIYKMLEKAFGIKSIIPLSHPHTPYFVGFLMIMAGISVPLIVFRRDAWCRKLFGFCRNIWSKICREFKGKGMPLFIILGTCFVLILIVSAVSKVGKAGAYSLRYISFFAPVFVAVALAGLYFVFRALLKKEIQAVSSVAVAVAVCAVLVNLTDRDFITNPTQTPNYRLTKMLEDQAVVGFFVKPDCMQFFPEIMRKTDKVWFDSYSKLFENPEYTEEIKDREQFYVMICAPLITWEKDMDKIKEEHVIFFDPKDTKEDLKSFNVQFLDDYVSYFEDMDFVDKIEYECESEFNGYKTMFFRVTNKK